MAPEKVRASGDKNTNSRRMNDHEILRGAGVLQECADESRNLHE
jgi:hypothetical protein